MDIIIIFTYILTAIYPTAPTNFHTCIGEKLVINSSHHYIINVNWNPPEGTYVTTVIIVQALHFICHR